MRGEGVSQDTKKAFEWYQKSAAQNNAQAQFNLGLHYYNGWRVTKNLTVAAKWYSLAADQGYTMALHNLAMMYQNGEGVIQSLKGAVKLYQLAAVAGEAKSINALGIMYYTGQGLPTDKILGFALVNYAQKLDPLSVKKSAYDEMKKLMQDTEIAESNLILQRMEKEKSVQSILSEKPNRLKLINEQF